jgi:hypothetical protein
MTAKNTTRRPTAAQRSARRAIQTSRAVFAVGVVVSLAANVDASEPTFRGVASGLWAPIAFLLAMALMENVPAVGLAGKARFVGMLFLAGIAGWVSYWHLVEFFTTAGMDSVSSHLLPLTVDVMMAFASPGMKAKTVRPRARRRAATKAKSNVRTLRAA